MGPPQPGGLPAPAVHLAGRRPGDFSRVRVRDVYLSVDTSFEDGLLKIRARVGTSERRGYYVAPLDDPSRVSELVPIDATGFSPIGNLGSAHYALTNLGAPRWRLVRIEQSDPRPERWRTIIAESELPLDNAALFNTCVVARHTTI